MIEWRWHLRPLTVRDRTANNLAEALDFGQPNLSAPAFAVPPGPFGFPCVGPLPPDGKFLILAELARSLGFIL